MKNVPVIVFEKKRGLFRQEFSEARVIRMLADSNADAVTALRTTLQPLTCRAAPLALHGQRARPVDDKRLILLVGAQGLEPWTR